MVLVGMGMGGMGVGFSSLGGHLNSNGIRLSAVTFPASSAQGTVIGNLSVKGGSGSYTFTLTGTAGNRFQVVGSQLQAGSAAAIAGPYTVTVHATSASGPTFDRSFVVTAV